MWRWSVILLVLVAGCGAYNPATQAPFSIEEVAASPRPAPDGGAPIAHELGAAASLVAAGPDYVIVHTANGPVRLSDGSGPESMNLVDASGSEVVTALTAMVPRVPAPQAPGAIPTPVTGVLALGPQGLLMDFAGYFESAGIDLPSPEQASALDDLGSGDAETIWVGVRGGLRQITKASSTNYSLSGESTAPAAVLQLDATSAWAAFGGKLYDLTLKQAQAAPLPYDFGQIHALARAGDLAYVAASSGLYAGDAHNHFKHWLAGQNVTGLAYDAINGLYLATDSALLLLAPDGSLLVEGALPSGSHAVAIDGFGDVWVSAGTTVQQFHVGKPVGYLNDVKPFFAANCYSCHVQQGPGTPAGTPKLPLDDYNGTRGLADEIVRRIQGQGGVMPPPPPTGVGQLPTSEYGVVIRWYRSGELP